MIQITKKLFPIEKLFIQKCLEAVYPIMEEDKILSEGEKEKIYSDGGRFLLSLTKSEIEMMKRIIDKIPHCLY